MERWIQIVGLSILGGIVLGIWIDINSQPIVFINEAQASTATNTIEKRVLLEVVFTWDKERIKQEIRNTFPEDPETAIKIANCESGLVINQIGRTSPDYGLMQINSPAWDRTAKKLGYGDYKTNPRHNLAMARYLYDRAGWQPWVCYTHHMI